MEKARTDFEYPRFSEQELTLFSEDLKSILTTDNLLKMSEEEARAKRQDSIEHLAVGLNDANINRDVVNLMINYTNDNEINRLHVLYAYKSVIDKANESDDFNVPNKLIDLVAKIASDEGEDSMAGDIMQLRVPFEELIGKNIVESVVEHEESVDEIDSEVSVINQTVHKIAKAYKEELELQADEEEEQLNEHIDSTFDELDNSVSPMHAQDVEILEEHSYVIDDLRQDIASGRFKTTEGLNVAIAAQDMELLKIYGEDEDELLKCLQLGRFMTPEGQAAAILKQDFERLKHSGYDADELLQNLVLHNFISKEGIRAAEYRQDSERLSKNYDTIEGLQKNLKLNNFLTPQGKAEAQKRIQDLES